MVTITRLLTFWLWLTTLAASNAVARVPASACVTDLNQDGVSNPQDLFDFLNLWFGRSSAADFNRDGVVDVNDVTAFIETWLAGCPSTPCSDGIDNNQDGFADFPLDPACASPSDSSETTATAPRKTTYAFAEWCSFYATVGTPYNAPGVPPEVTHNVQYPWVLYPEDPNTLDPQYIMSYYSHLPPDVPRAMFSYTMEFGVSISDPRVNIPNDPHYHGGFDPADDFPGTNIPSPWQDRWLQTVSQRADNFFRAYQAAGGRLDILNMDAEYLGPEFSRRDLIAQDPRFTRTSSNALIQPGDFMYAPLAQTMGNNNLLNNVGCGGDCERYWGLLSHDWSTAYLNKGLFRPLQQYFPQAKVSNFAFFNNDFENYYAPVYNALTRCLPGYYCSIGSIFGNTQGIGIFYDWGVPGAGTQSFDGLGNPYLQTPFNNLKLTINLLKQAVLSNPSAPIAPTFASRNIYRGDNVRIRVAPSTDYYQEGVFHVFLMGAPHAFLWTENRHRFTDDFPLSVAMDEFDRIAGFADRQTTFMEDTGWVNGMRTGIDQRSWADDVVLTCTQAGGEDREICRITPEQIPAGGGLPELTVANFLVAESDGSGNARLTFRSRQKTIEVPGGVIWRPSAPATVSNLGYWFAKQRGTRIIFSPSGLNTPPTARLYAYQTGERPYEIVVGAIGSSDPDGRIARFSYDFNDDGVFDDHVIQNGQDIGDIYDHPNANPGWFQYTYGQPRSHTVAVKVIDDRGAATIVRTPVFTLSTARPLCHPEFNIFHIPEDCLLGRATQAPL